MYFFPHNHNNYKCFLSTKSAYYNVELLDNMILKTGIKMLKIQLCHQE